MIERWTVAVKEWPCTCWSIANKNRCEESVSLLFLRNLEMLNSCLVWKHSWWECRKPAGWRGYCWEIETELLPWQWAQQLNQENKKWNCHCHFRDFNKAGDKQPFEVLPKFELGAGSTPTNGYSARAPSSSQLVQLQQPLAHSTGVSRCWKARCWNRYVTSKLVQFSCHLCKCIKTWIYSFLMWWVPSKLETFILVNFEPGGTVLVLTLMLLNGLVSPYIFIWH